MIEVVSSLNSQMHDPGVKIVPRHQTMNDLHLVAQGNCELYGYFKDAMGMEYRTLLVSLPTQSWYGDFQIMLDI